MRICDIMNKMLDSDFVNVEVYDTDKHEIVYTGQYIEIRNQYGNTSFDTMNLFAIDGEPPYICFNI